jgi:hypothetical protein
MNLKATKRLFGTFAMLLAFTLLPQTLLSTGEPVLATATVCAQTTSGGSGTCCESSDLCIYQPPCSGWGPWQECPPPEEYDGYWHGGGGPCPD